MARRFSISSLRRRVRDHGALAAVVVVVYLCIGHGLSGSSMGMHDMNSVGHGIGICLVLVSLVAVLALKLLRSSESWTSNWAPFALPAFPSPPSLPSRAGARASPIWLQRFLQ